MTARGFFRESDLVANGILSGDSIASHHSISFEGELTADSA
jgi:hypothetical protein